MKKNRSKPKATVKEPALSGARGQVVKIKPGKPKTPWTSKLPPVKQYWLGTKQFVVEAWQELKKVVWPNRKETLGGTAMVLFLVVVISIFLGLVDFGLSRLVRQFIH